MERGDGSIHDPRHVDRLEVLSHQHQPQQGRPDDEADQGGGIRARRGDHYVFALTYGSDVQWLKNIFAAGGCEMRIRGRDVRLVEPELIVDPDLRLMPLPLRIADKLNRVTEFLRMRAA